MNMFTPSRWSTNDRAEEQFHPSLAWWTKNLLSYLKKHRWWVIYRSNHKTATSPKLLTPVWMMVSPWIVRWGSLLLWIFHPLCTRRTFWKFVKMARRTHSKERWAEIHTARRDSPGGNGWDLSWGAYDPQTLLLGGMSTGLILRISFK